MSTWLSSLRPEMCLKLETSMDLQLSKPINSPSFYVRQLSRFLSLAKKKVLPNGEMQSSAGSFQLGTQTTLAKLNSRKQGLPRTLQLQLTKGKNIISMILLDPRTDNPQIVSMSSLLSAGIWLLLIQHGGLVDQYTASLPSFFFCLL